MLSSLLLLVLASMTTASASSHFTCYPNDTLVVDIPDLGGPVNYVIANDSTTNCNVTYDNQLATITGCNLNDPICVLFASTTMSVITKGRYKGYVLECGSLREGFTKTIVNKFTPTMTVHNLKTITPPCTISSTITLNCSSTVPAIIARAGETFCWSFDIPKEYYALPKVCRAITGNLPITGTTEIKELIEDGCSKDLVAIDNFSHSTSTVIGNIRRYSTNIQVTVVGTLFFPGTNIRVTPSGVTDVYTTYYCDIQLCLNIADCQIQCGGIGKRSAPEMSKDLDIQRTVTSLTMQETPRSTERLDESDGAPEIDVVDIEEYSVVMAGPSNGIGSMAAAAILVLLPVITLLCAL